MRDLRSTLQDLAAGVIVATALALPVVQLTGDSAARMKVHFRTESGEKPRILSTETSSSVCAVMAAALSYGSPDTGAFTEVNCSEEAAAAP